MKTKKQFKLKIWLATLSVALFSGLLAFGSYATENYIKSKAISYNDETYKITLSAEELNTKTFNNFSVELDNQVDIVYSINDVIESLLYGSDTGTLDTESSEDNGYRFAYYLDNVNSDYIQFNGTDSNNTFELYLGSETLTPFSNSLELTFTAESYEAIKTAIDLDLQANTPTFSGQIIDAIKSGLGLIGQLAQEFLLGFTTLFWTGTELTEFGIFSLCFLGLTISFAIVRLAMNIVRSNTGV